MKALNEHIKDYFIGNTIKYKIDNEELIGICTDFSISNDIASNGIPLIDIEINGSDKYSVSKNFKIEILK